jgi:type II secretory pathway pseudopilin PulG
VLFALAVASILMLALGAAVQGAFQTWGVARERNEVARQARFAMDRMVASVRGASLQMLPLAENPSTAYSESVRDVLAVSLGSTLDRDGDGFADADNDRDGRVDEDFDRDSANDGQPGIPGVDDDGDGVADEGAAEDDDEDGTANEDPINGLDDDGDGAIDEDPARDANADGQPGVAGFDDDGDGSTDEGSLDDDDEDGLTEEDWLDPIVYFLNGTGLIGRMPDLNPADGLDFTESVIAEGVTQFRAERIARSPSARAVLVDLTLELAGTQGETVSLNARVRVGGNP